MSDYFQHEQFQPTPYVMFTPNKVINAFELIEESKHIGKVVLEFKGQEVDIERQEAIIRANKTYLITGGTRGLGLEIGVWLAEHGAKNLILLSRSGVKEEDTQNKINELISIGINVRVCKVDITDKAQIQTILSKILKEMPKLAGVFHCAMVLDDALLLDLDEQQFRKVLKPKVDGAENLVEFIDLIDLDFFLMFSSISSLIGNIGQGNYVAANAFLDSFAFNLKNRGVNAITVNLGVMKDSGVVSRNKKLSKVLKNFGTLGLTNGQFFEGLEYILKTRPIQVGFFNLDWEAFYNNTGDSSKFLFRDVLEQVKSFKKGFTKEQMTTLEELSRKDYSGQQQMITEILIKEVSLTLKIKQDKVNPDIGINFLGVDSILAIELIKRIKNRLIVGIIPMEFFSGPSINELSVIILERLRQKHLS